MRTDEGSVMESPVMDVSPLLLPATFFLSLRFLSHAHTHAHTHAVYVSGINHSLSPHSGLKCCI